MNKKKTALVIGATGATGKALVKLLLTNEAYAQVHTFVRKKSLMQHDKLVEHVVNFDHVENWNSLLAGDVAYSCLGTTLKAAGGKEAQWKVDYTYQYEFASNAKRNGVHTFVLVSSMGANAAATLFYNKMKGKLEVAIQGLGFSKILIFRPGPLIRPLLARPMEKVSISIINWFNRLGLLQSLKPTKTQLLAEKMIAAASRETDGIHIYENQTIHKML